MGMLSRQYTEQMLFAEACCSGLLTTMLVDDTIQQAEGDTELHWHIRKLSSCPDCLTEALYSAID